MEFNLWREKNENHSEERNKIIQNEEYNEKRTKEKRKQKYWKLESTQRSKLEKKGNSRDSLVIFSSYDPKWE